MGADVARRLSQGVGDAPARRADLSQRRRSGGLLLWRDLGVVDVVSADAAYAQALEAASARYTLRCGGLCRDHRGQRMARTLACAVAPALARHRAWLGIAVCGLELSRRAQLLFEPHPPRHPLVRQGE